MRRISFALLCLVLLAVGCTTTPDQPPVVNEIVAQNEAGSIIGRNMAYAVGRNNPDILDTAIAFCSAFEAEDVDMEPMIALGLKYLDAEVQDYPFLKEDLQSLLNILNIPILMDDNIPLTDRQKELVRIIARAMKRGFEEAKANPKVSWSDITPRIL